MNPQMLGYTMLSNCRQAASVPRLGALCLLLFFAGELHIASAQPSERLVISADFQTVPQRKAKFAFPPIVAKPKLDGELNDPCWSRGLQIDQLALGSDMPSGRPTRATSVRVCRDAENLYIAFECEEPGIGTSQPEKGQAETRYRENVQVYLSPWPNARDFFVFTVALDNSHQSWSLEHGAAWDADWSAYTSRAGDKWCAEIAIPFETVGVVNIAENLLWLANFGRDSGSTCEQWSWEPTRGNRRNPALWGEMFFGPITAYENLYRAPSVELYPERCVIEPGDKTLRVVARITPAPQMALNSLKLQTSLEPEGSVDILSAPDCVTVRGERVSLVLNAGAIPVGQHRLKVALLNGTKELAAQTQTLTRRSSENPSAAKPGNIEIILPENIPPSPYAHMWPVTTGVALPKGALYSAENVRLRASNGQEIPVQGTPRARWPQDGSVRWLGLDFQANLMADAGKRYTLEYGQGIRNNTPTNGFIRKVKNLPFDTVGDSWVMNTGKLLFTVNHRRFAGFKEAWMDVDCNGRYDWYEQILISTDRMAGPFIVNANGRRYRLTADDETQLVLEDWNELRLVLRGEGRLVPDDADSRNKAEIGRCIIRIIAYAGLPFVRAQYTFILGEQATPVPISEIGVLDKLDLGKRYEVIFPVQDGFRQPIDKSGPLSFMKVLPDQFQIYSLVPSVDIIRQGTESENWVCLAGANRGLAVCMKDMGQLHPKGFDVRPDSLTIHLWPPHGDDRMRQPSENPKLKSFGNLNFAHFGRLLDLRVPSSYIQELQEHADETDYASASDAHFTDATGVGLTCDLLYIFYTGELDEGSIRSTAATFEARPHALQDPSSLAASGVFSERLPPERAARASAMAFALLSTENLSAETGAFNYMDVHRKWNTATAQWDLANRWMGTTTDLAGALWMLYIQTGNLQLLRAAERNTRHLMTVDMCRSGAPELAARTDMRIRKIPGAFADHRTPVHWQSACHVSDRFAHIRGLLLEYYLTGNMAAREAAQLWATAARHYGTLACGADGAAFMGNLQEMLYLNYDPILLELLGQNRAYFSQVHFEPNPVVNWGMDFRQCLNTYDNMLALPSNIRTGSFDQQLAGAFGGVGLIRDLYLTTGDMRYKAQADKIIADFEADADRKLPHIADGNNGTTWADLCSYIFGATEPIKHAD